MLAGERLAMPVTADLAVFGPHDPVLIHMVPRVDFP